MRIPVSHGVATEEVKIGNAVIKWPYHVNLQTRWTFWRFLPRMGLAKEVVAILKRNRLLLECIVQSGYQIGKADVKWL